MSEKKEWTKPNLEVIRDAYGFTISSEGEVLGLVAGDHGYTDTKIQLDDTSLEIWKLGLEAWDQKRAETLAQKNPPRSHSNPLLTLWELLRYGLLANRRINYKAILPSGEEVYGRLPFRGPLDEMRRRELVHRARKHIERKTNITGAVVHLFDTP